MKPGFDTTFEQLYSREGLIALDARFVDGLKTHHVELHNRLVTARATPPHGKEESQLIVDLAPHVEDFISELFNIRTELTALKGRHFELAPLYSCKRLFVQRKAIKSINAADAAKLNGKALEAELAQKFGGEFSELLFAATVMKWLDA